MYILLYILLYIIFPNTLKTERQDLKLLQDDNNIIILPADKGIGTVVINRMEYSNNLVDYLQCWLL